MTNDKPLAYTTPDWLTRDFTIRGLVVLPPESLGIPLDTHDRIYERQKQVTEPPNRAALSQVPEVLEILNAPGVVAACNRLVGENWASFRLPLSPSPAMAEIRFGTKTTTVPRTAENSVTIARCRSRFGLCPFSRRWKFGVFGAARHRGGRRQITDSRLP